MFLALSTKWPFELSKIAKILKIPSVQHIGSTQGPQLFSPKIPQFNTKNPSVPHPLVQHPKSLSSTPKNPLSSTPPRFHIHLSSTREPTLKENNILRYLKYWFFAIKCIKYYFLISLYENFQI